MSARLKNKVIVITGGNSGIGYATAEKIIAEGGYAIIVGKDKKKVEEASKKLGNKSSAFVADVSKLADLENLFKKIRQEFDVIHGLVVNAGIANLERYEDVTEDSFNASVEINFKGAFFTAQKATPLLQNGGSIVFISSLAAHRTFKGASIYSATKAAICSLSSTLSLELASKNIRCNSISPGTIITPIFNKMGLAEDEFKITIEKHQSKIALGRCGEPEEIANATLFLLSDESSYITGTDLIVDGGLARFIT